ncbi:Hypothetical_protein [Hexamita inflata]|uniref:Hypothetical_protein n=1 Tax=Hexamita inflata TaxID=28002 RepID=A0AA86PW25_9EUKA|nr:Hypothetical protein HINF_LOCUS29797 [Hexamita inflata]
MIDHIKLYDTLAPYLIQAFVIFGHKFLIVKQTRNNMDLYQCGVVLFNKQLKNMKFSSLSGQKSKFLLQIIKTTSKLIIVCHFVSNCCFSHQYFNSLTLKQKYFQDLFRKHYVFCIQPMGYQIPCTVNLLTCGLAYFRSHLILIGPALGQYLANNGF